MTRHTGRGPGTAAVHTPPATVPAAPPFSPPVYRTSTFAFATAGEYADVLNGVEPGYSYSRIDNPTADAFAAAVAALEGANLATEVSGQPFASGMAAISTTAMALLSAGDHVVCQSALYGGTWSVFSRVLRRFGVEVTFAGAPDAEVIAAAITPRTKLVWVEAIANPTLVVADLPGIAAVAHDAGALLGCDATFASPMVVRPLEYGVDLVVHSATKYLGGHSDATGGVVCARHELTAAVRALRIDLGGSLAPDEAFLLHRGIATLPLRLARHCQTAAALATALAEHPAVAAVHYPGLPGHPHHARARELFDPDRFGGMVTVDLYGDRSAGMAFCDALALAVPAASLGGTHTLVSHAASTTHRQFDDASLAAAGITPSQVRISVGLEDAADLIADAAQALDSLAR